MVAGISSKVKWKIFISEVLMQIIPIYTGFSIIDLTSIDWLSLVLGLFIILINLWRISSKKIIADEYIRFKRFIVKDLVFEADEIKEIMLFVSTKLSFKRSFLEIHTSDRYYVYHIDYFDLDEMNVFMSRLASEWKFTYKKENEVEYNRGKQFISGSYDSYDNL